MRLNDLNDGSIKTFLILGLIIANLAAARPDKSERSQLPGSARASRAVFGALAESFSGSRALSPEALGEARPLPGLPPP